MFANSNVLIQLAARERRRFSSCNDTQVKAGGIVSVSNFKIVSFNTGQLSFQVSLVEAGDKLFIHSFKRTPVYTGTASFQVVSLTRSHGYGITAT